MKQNILLGSVGSSVFATVMGIGGVLNNSASAISIALMFGFLGIATFFVGWAYPVENLNNNTVKTKRGA